MPPRASPPPRPHPLRPGLPWLPLGLALGGCADHDHDQGGDAHGDHGHGDHDHGAADDERPALRLTVTTPALEAFVELPALVVGQSSPLLAHLTDVRDLTGFQAVREGSLRIILRMDGGAETSAQATAPVRPGIFAPALRPTAAGPARLLLQLSGDAAGEVDLGAVTVHADLAAARAAAAPEADAPGAVPFLKETQWQLPFATTVAVEAPLREVVRATGTLLAPPEAQAHVDSPTAGRFTMGPALRLGARVSAGALLGQVSPLAGGDGGEARAAAEAARAQEALAQAALRRAEALHPAVVSARELEQARAALQAAAGQRAAAEGRQRAWSGGAGGGAELRAPIDGVIAFVQAEPGQVLTAGAPIATVIDPATIWVQAEVFAADLPRARGTSGAMVEIPGREAPLHIDAEAGGAVLAVGVAADPVRRTVPVLYSAPNPGDLLPGTPVGVQVYGAAGPPVVAIPHSAVVDDRGADVVFVQIDGELYARRRVRLGPRDGALVAVIEGVSAGERVVSLGAYELLLSTAAGGIPAHGHGH
jgi:cobalt-zinc-cadmium efflux system membrane fusion protein